MTFESSSPPDPALVFSNGQRTIDFTFEPNSQQAKEPSGFALQTGTISGTVIFSVEWSASGASTSASTISHRSVIRAAPPAMTRIACRKDYENRQLIVELVGYSTTRQLSQVSLRFTPTVSGKLSTTELLVPLRIDADRWFASSESRQFGGLFQLVQRINVQGSLDDVLAVGASIVNDLGTGKEIAFKF